VDQTWPALYTSLSPEIAVWEMVRRGAERHLAYLQNNLLTELIVDLSRVLDVSEPTSLGLKLVDLTGPDPEVCRQLASAARTAGFMGLVVPSAAIAGLNLVILPDNLPDPVPPRTVNSREMPVDVIRGRPS